MKNPGKLEFEAEIIDNEGVGAYINFPFDVPDLFGTRGWVRVKAAFDGVLYRGSLANMGTGCHVLIIVKAIRQQIGKQPGDSVHVTVELDEEPRLLELPEELQSGFEQNPAAQAFFDKLSFSKQREYVLWITQAKRAETRQQRIEKTIALLLEHKKLR
jgi:hypothetical protein